LVKDGRWEEPDKPARFEEAVLPHLDSAHNLARWLVRNDHDAEDLVQEACLRALKSFDGFRGGDPRAWLLAIVPNRCYTWQQENRLHDVTTTFDEQIQTTESRSHNPEALLLVAQGQGCVAGMPAEISPNGECLVVRSSNCPAVRGVERRDSHPPLVRAAMYGKGGFAPDRLHSRT
jgi:RNA polymerase sigma factor (sigma-70 family)